MEHIDFLSGLAVFVQLVSLWKIVEVSNKLEHRLTVIEKDVEFLKKATIARPMR